jgi:antitoxin HicB
MGYDDMTRNVMTNKMLNYYLNLPYTIELTPDEDGYWFAQIPLLPGCITQGASRTEALAALDEAKALWLETALAEGISIPEPVGAESR